MAIMKEFMIKIPNKFLKVSSVYPNFHRNIGIVSNEIDLKKGEAKNRSIKWVIVDKNITVSDFINNKDNKIVFFTNDLDQLLDDLVNDGYNSYKAGQKPKPTQQQVIAVQELVFTSVEMVNIFSKLDDKQAEAFMLLRKTFDLEEAPLTDEEIQRLVYKGLQEDNDLNSFLELL